MLFSRCGYCDEEIYTRYAATYHNKYKHPGEPRNFIKDEQDVSIYYVNRAKAGNSGNSNTAPTAPMDSQQNNQTRTESFSSNENDDNYHQYGVVGKSFTEN